MSKNFLARKPSGNVKKEYSKQEFESEKPQQQQSRLHYTSLEKHIFHDKLYEADFDLNNKSFQDPLQSNNFNSNYPQNQQLSPEKEKMGQTRKVHLLSEPNEGIKYKNLEFQELFVDKKDNLFVQKKIKALETNAKYFEAQAHPLFLENSQLKDQMIEINEMIRERTKDFSNLIRDKNENGETRDLIKKIGDLEAIYGVLKFDIDYYQNTLSNLSNEKTRMIKKINDLEEMLKDCDLRHQLELEKQKLDYEAKLDNLNKIITDQDDNIKKIQKQLQAERDDKELQLEKKNVEISSLMKIMQQQKDKMKSMDFDFQNQKKTLETIINTNKERFLQEKKDLIDKYEYQIREMKENYDSKIEKLKDDYELKIKNFQDELNIRNEIIKRMQNEYNKLKQESTDEINRLKDLLSKERLDNQRLRDTLNSLNGDLSQLLKNRDDLESERNRLIIQLTELQNLYLTLETNYINLQKEKQKEYNYMSSVIQNLKDDLKKQEEDWKIKLQRLTIEFELKIRETISDLTSKYEKQLKDLREELEKALNNLDSERSEQIRKLTIRIQELEIQLQTLKLRTERDFKELNEKYNEMERKLQLQIQEQDHFYKEMIQDLKNEMKTKLDESEERRISELKQLDERTKQEIEELTNEKDAKYNTMHEKLTSEIQNMEKNLTKKYNIMENKLLSRIHELEEELKKQFIQLEEKRKTEIKDLKDYYEAELKRLKQLLEGNAQGMLDELRENHRKELDNLKQMYDDKLRRLEEEWQNKMDKKCKEYDDTIKSLKALLEKEREEHSKTKERMNQMKIQYENDILTIKHQFQEIQTRLDEEIYELKRKIRELETELLRLKNQYEEFKNYHNQQIQIKDNEINKWKTQFSEFEKSLRKKLEDEYNQFLIEQMEFIEKMKNEHNLLLNSHKQRCDELKIEYKELEKLFHERPSRPDDIKHIKLLMKECDVYKRNLGDAEIKVMHANELENYKNVYDIFGPGKKLPNDLIDSFQQLNNNSTSQQQLSSQNMSIINNQKQNQNAISMNNNNNSNSVQNDGQNQNTQIINGMSLISQQSHSQQGQLNIGGRKTFKKQAQKKDSNNTSMDQSIQDISPIRNRQKTTDIQQLSSIQSNFQPISRFQQNHQSPNERNATDRIPELPKINSEIKTQMQIQHGAQSVDNKYKKITKRDRTFTQQYQNPLENSSLIKNAEKFVEENLDKTQNQNNLQQKPNMYDISSNQAKRQNSQKNFDILSEHDGESKSKGSKVSLQNSFAIYNQNIEIDPQSIQNLKILNQQSNSVFDRDQIFGQQMISSKSSNKRMKNYNNSKDNSNNQSQQQQQQLQQSKNANSESFSKSKNSNLLI